MVTKWRYGYIDVCDKSMLVTLSWWQFLNVSDRISILVTIFGCWCPTLMVKHWGCWWPFKPFLSMFSSTHFVSNIRHQHRCSHFVPNVLAPNILHSQFKCWWQSWNLVINICHHFVSIQNWNSFRGDLKFFTFRFYSYLVLRVSWWGTIRTVVRSIRTELR